MEGEASLAGESKGKLRKAASVVRIHGKFVIGR
jgi:hypothetical protein